MAKKPKLTLTVSLESKDGLEKLRKQLNLNSISELVDKLGAGELPLNLDLEVLCQGELSVN